MIYIPQKTLQLYVELFMFPAQPCRMALNDETLKFRTLLFYIDVDSPPQLLSILGFLLHSRLDLKALRNAL